MGQKPKSQVVAGTIRQHESIPPRDTSRRWVEVDAAKPWNPKSPGEEIVGTYGGEVVKSYGESSYSRFIVHTHTKTLYVTGSSVTDLFEVSELEVGDVVKVQYVETKKTRSNRDYRVFRLFKEVQ